ncbi:MAG: hypothetical protein K6T83_07250 [Alicyclobacillus sp.]|nr:hypothetical protein [Alicyclobacillus sp.]
MRQNSLWWVLCAAVFLLVLLAIPSILHFLALVLVIAILAFTVFTLQPKWRAQLKRRRPVRWRMHADTALLCAILLVIALVILFAH